MKNLEVRLAKLESKCGRPSRGLVIFLRVGDDDEQTALAAEYQRLGLEPMPDDSVICFRAVSARRES
ncbi:MAG: hypothetical protein PSV18_13070 [Methylobacter sp.]|uniref:Uncharacterized protein n=1 Tax=Candidatus Methylobacter titanis TaxID=3053457 RepID=A0AA43Q1K1_9GAMM|nr:hypothetical protein [Candidatus Methylobacter titanis]MDI1293659.1 hypothetical protein [Candidatus Methylobacter titanis]